jgi:hypothetical protein
MDPSIITYQTVATKEANIVVPISRFLERELTRTPVRKPEIQTARASVTTCASMSHVPFLVGIARTNNFVESTAESGRNMHMHNMTPAIRTQVGFTPRLMLFIKLVDILSPHFGRTGGLGPFTPPDAPHAVTQALLFAYFAIHVRGFERSDFGNCSPQQRAHTDIK